MLKGQRRMAVHRSGNPQGQKYPGRVRIISGQWRGRYIDVADAESLRPTGARVRETLFNWLAPTIEGARCLDLFAGSGVLGFEAASRGAASVTLVDSDASRVAELRSTIKRLDATTLTVVHADALQWLSGMPQQFNVIFLDPPFRQDWIARCLQQLERPGWLAAGALIYVEIEAEAEPPRLPPNWRVHRDKQAGNVHYLLIRTGVD
jgi:16S rRNA (guanine966-N2)-methyltransferase